MDTAINKYNKQFADSHPIILVKIAECIGSVLPEAVGKVWHGHPVWFINENPIVGYNVRKDIVHLIFWSGQSFEEENLKAIGKFKAAEIQYTSDQKINTTALKKWLKKSKVIQWDYKNLIKRKGVLMKL